MNKSKLPSSATPVKKGPSPATPMATPVGKVNGENKSNLNSLTKVNQSAKKATASEGSIKKVLVTKGKADTDEVLEISSLNDDLQSKVSDMTDREFASTNCDHTGRDNIKVCVRLRPLVKNEREMNEPLAWMWEENTITQNYLPSHVRSNVDNQEDLNYNYASYAFDHLYYPEHSNANIFDSVVKPIVSRAMHGFHASVFAYGQTSSGKTHTMNGTAKQPGIIPLAIYECFDKISELKEREFLFRVSYLEIYNEAIHDLLNPELTQIKIQHDPKTGNVVLVGVKEQVVVNPEQVFSLLQGGEAFRHVGSTDMNDKSSRAHTLFKLIIESKMRSEHCESGSNPVRVSTLNLVDLAGSENAKMTNSKGERAIEAKFINQSLLTLSTIIHRLSEEKPGSLRKQHLPYRDSKLTRILQQPLSGNAYIIIVCTISPSLRCAEESHNTLKFGSRAKLIKVDAKVNESMDDKTLLRAYRKEIDDLRKKLALLENKLESNDRLPTTEIGEGCNEDEESPDLANQEFLMEMIEQMEKLILKGEEQNKTKIDSSKDVKNKPNLKTSTIPRLRPPKKLASMLPTVNSSRQSLPASNHLSNRNSNSPTTQQLSRASTADSTDFQDNKVTKESLSDHVAPQPEPDEFELSLLENGISNGDSDNKDVDDGFFSSRVRLNSLDKELGTRRSTIDIVSSPRYQVTAPRLQLGDEKNLDEETKNKPIAEGNNVISGIRQMLGILKQHVTKAQQGDQVAGVAVIPSTIGRASSHSHRRLSGSNSTVDSEPRQSKDGISDSSNAELIQNLKLKEADNRFLQGEVERLQEEVQGKHTMLSILTEGLKEVEVNHSALIASEEAMSQELDLTKQAYNELATENRILIDENNVLRDEVIRLVAALDAREKQLFAITGKSAEEEEF